MQIGKDQLKAQQEIMAAKNMYNGKIDGIWGPLTIAAKQKWERSGKFSPAVPNNGFPLNDRQALPPGVLRKPDGTLYCMEQKSAASAPVAPVVATPEPQAPVVETPVVETPPVQQKQQQNNNNGGNKHQQNQNQNQKGFQQS